MWILSSVSVQSRETWILEMPGMSMACTRSSAELVETPGIQADWMSVLSIFTAIGQGPTKPGK